MKYDAMQYPHASRRMVVQGRGGMVATSQHLAAQAGLAILRNGGNAIDAAVATAACLTVVEPTSNGLGGDAFALVWHNGQLHGLNASGPAPQALSVEAVQAAGYKELPRFGWLPVTVPGQVAGWSALLRRFGRMSLTEVLQPAIEYAGNGYPVSSVVSGNWQKAYELYRKELQGEEFKSWFQTFAPEGRAPRSGEVFRLPEVAATLRRLADTQGEDFYRGEIAKQIAAFAQQTGGFIRAADLAAYQPQWVEPIRVNYRGYDVWEIPPNGHGLVALLALNILKGFPPATLEAGQVEFYHQQIEAMKLAFADGKRYIADPAGMQVAVEALLSDSYAAERRSLIGTEAIEPVAGNPAAGGTVYVAIADGDGNMVSYIQSNYMGFGSGLVVPGTGIALHNRGHNFSLDPQHDNCLAPGKKPYHTIIPGFLTKDDKAVGPFGVMGAFMQPQGHLQVISNSLDYQLNPQAALDAPRWQWVGGKHIEVEPHFPLEIIKALRNMGHIITVVHDPTGFGRGQIIWRDPSGVLTGGTEPRADSAAAAW